MKAIAASGGASAIGWAPGSSATTDDGSAQIVADVRSLAQRGKQNLTLLLPAGSEPNVRPVIERFEAETSVSVTVRLAPVDDINTELLLTSMQRDNSPDLALVASFGLPDLVQRNVLRPIDDLESRYPAAASMRRQSLYQIADEFDGHAYGPQFDGDLYLLFFNAAILNDPALRDSYERQYERPFGAATRWQDLDRMMQLVHESNRALHGGVLFRTPRYITWEFWARLHASGQLPFDDDMRPTLNSVNSVRAIEAMIDAGRWQHPDVGSAGLVENWQLFCEGRSLCHIGWGGSQKYFLQHKTELSEGVIVAQLPGLDQDDGKTPLPLFNWGWNFAIPARAVNTELAFLFAAFAVSPDIAVTAVSQADGFIDPFQPGHYSDKRIVATYGDAFLKTHADGMRRAIPDLYIKGHSDYMEALSNALTLAHRGQINAVEAANSVVIRWERITERLGRSAQALQWQRLKQQYPAGLVERLSSSTI
ncbi:MAG: extracellular solute-binding protein [Pseudomonadota bacterium]